jgi:predicted ATPase
VEGAAPDIGASGKGLAAFLARLQRRDMPETPSLILLDELEDGLHPALLGSVVEMLGELARDKAVQVIATTHSPITLNYLESGKQVLLVHRARSGAAKVTPFSELHDFSDLRQYFDLGEMWYNVGEDRLLGRK